MTIDCGLARDEYSVVRLGLIRDHAKFVRFSVVNVHMNHRRVTKGLKIGHAVVDVECQFKIVSTIEVVEWGEATFEDKRKLGGFTSREERRWLLENERYLL